MSSSSPASAQQRGAGAVPLRACPPSKQPCGCPSELLALFVNPLVIILLIAGVVSFLLGNATDATIILVMVLLGVSVNFLQTYRSQRAIERAACRYDGSDRDCRRFASVLASRATSGLHRSSGTLLRLPRDSNSDVPLARGVCETAALRTHQSVSSPCCPLARSILDITARCDRRHFPASGPERSSR